MNDCLHLQCNARNHAIKTGPTVADVKSPVLTQLLLGPESVEARF